MGRFSKPKMGIKTMTVNKLPKNVKGKAIKGVSLKHIDVYHYGNTFYYVRKKKKR